MESSNIPDHVESTGADVASAAEQTDQSTAGREANFEAPEVEQNLSLEDRMRARASKDSDVPRGTDGKFAKNAGEKASEPAVVPPEGTEATVAPDAADPNKPKYEPNFKYKAFGKERELDEMFRPLIKDAETEKKVKDVFTKADAFDEFKGRYENANQEHQKVLQQFNALDRDVRRVTKFLNTGDLDNFFQSLRVSDDMLLQHLQKKADIARLGPQHLQAYEQTANQRAQMYDQQEQYESMQRNFATQQVQHRTMQLDMAMSRPEVTSAASAWDSKMGMGAFRDLVIQEAQNVWHSTKQDMPAEAAIQLVMNKYGKLLEASAPQAPAQATAQQTTQQTAPHAPQPAVVVKEKPVVPVINGRGTSPVKQVPKSLDDLKRMGRELAGQESWGTVVQPS